MGFGDKARHKIQESKGKLKEDAGRATGDRELEAKGQGDQLSANMKQAGEHVKDSLKSVRNAFRH